MSTLKTIDPSTPVTVEHDVASIMRDGTVLRNDIYRPISTGKFPTLVERTPYNKKRDKDKGTQLAQRGFVYISQDVRGRYSSEGDFTPGFFRKTGLTDSQDGYDTIEWAGGLPYSNGNVGTVGCSYAGWTQMELAHSRPPHLKAIMPQAIASNLLDREMGGVLRLGRILWWTINTLTPNQRSRAKAKWGSKSTEESERAWTEQDRSKWLWFLPLRDIPDNVMFGMGSHWRHWLDNHTIDNFNFGIKHSKIEVPALVTTGWYDQQVGSIQNFMGMVKNASTESARNGTRLIVGPWSHVGNKFERTLGRLDFGEEAVMDYYELVTRWFNYWLSDKNPVLDSWPPIQLFVMGENRWRYEEEWPVRGTKYMDFFIHGGQINEEYGHGTLSEEPPKEESSDTYYYDPRDPVMTLYSTDGQHEPHDQRLLGNRPDILRYTTSPLLQPKEITGPITMKLWASSSARDTDFIVKLMDVWPDGFTQELCYGIVRARFRDSYEKPTLLVPGQPYEFTINLNPTSNLFKRNHRIQITLSSSDFPNFDRNHNTGGNDYAESILKTAKQTIYHNWEHPSRIILPVMPR